MQPVALNLVVLRVPDLQRAVDFYALLGLSFTKHAHGKGPEHYAAELGGLVFEIYPQTSEENSTKHVRIGFRISHLDGAIQRLESGGGVLVSPPKMSPWGLRAIIDDPFGHRIELSEAEAAVRPV
ncbi:MAG: VOC family protein [Opitutaceae bacterium]|nr:VOC family protein [Opitutaceae bacterium]